MLRNCAKKGGQPGDKWHLDEIFIKINGKTHYLWRAVDQNGMVLDILVTRRRNKEAAKRFFLKLLRGLKYELRVIITDKLRSYGTALREVLPHVEHRQHKGLNNRAYNSHRASGSCVTWKAPIYYLLLTAYTLLLTGR